MNNKTGIRHPVYVGEAGIDATPELRAGLDFIGWDKYITKQSRVFVKPNFTFHRYKEGVTTSPELLECLLQLLKTKAGSVTLGESDGGNHSFTAEQAFEGHNMYRICRDAGVELVNLSSLPAETVEGTILGKTVSVSLPRMLLHETDCFISVPVLKVHAMTGVSLSLKNLWGCLPDTMRGLHHQNLKYKLSLIAQSLKPRIVVIDGIYALNKHGPMYGEAVRTNLVVVADNPVAADATGARLMGFSPQHIGHIAVAARAGLGSADPADIKTSRDWKPLQKHFHVEKSIIDNISVLLFHSDLLARLVMDSSLTPAIYRVAGKLRSAQEKELAFQLHQRKILGPY